MQYATVELAALPIKAEDKILSELPWLVAILQSHHDKLSSSTNKFLRNQVIRGFHVIKKKCRYATYQEALK